MVTPTKFKNLFYHGGEMGKLMEEKDWSKTALGPPEEWPQSLRLMVSVMLENPIAMCISWGKEHIQLYNDAYCPILGENKHPSALGASSRDSFSEVWHIAEPMITKVFEGNSIRHPDMPFLLNRNGQLEECYFDFSYTPIRIENGAVGGFLITVIETTSKINYQKALKESKDQLEFAIETTDLGTFDLNPKTNKFTANNRLKELFGFSNELEFDLSLALAAVIKKDKKRLITAIEKALLFESGGKFEIEYTLENHITGDKKVVIGKGKVWYDENNIAIRFNGTVQDITEQALAEKEKQKLIAIINASEEYIGLTGIDSKIQFINPAGLKMLGWDSYEGRSMMDCIYPKGRALAQKDFPKLLQSDTEYNEIQFWNEKNGNPFWIQWNGIRIKDSITDQVIGLATVSPNITEQKKTKEKIKSSEANLRQMIIQAPVAIAIFRGEDCIVEIANQKALELWGHSEKEILNQPLFESMPELLNQGIDKIINKVYQTDSSFSNKELQIKVVRGNKLEILYINFSCEPLYDSSGKVNGIMAIGFDVSEQVNARRIVEANEEKLNIIINASDLGIWEYDVKKEESICSDRCVEILGYKHKRNVTHDQLLKNIHPEDLAIRNEAVLKSLETGYLHYTTRVIWEDSSIHWAELKGKVFYNSKNEPIKILGTIRDISEERFSQQLLIEREQNFRLLADSMPQFVWTSDPSGNLNYFNQSVFDYTGLTFDQILEKNWIEIVHPDDRVNNIEKWTNSINTGEDFLFEHRFKKLDGSYRWQLSRATPQKDENGNIRMWVGTSTDIQDQKMFTNELEKQVTERTTELKQKNIDLQNMNRELQSFAYISSHDLQEPLRKIQIFASRIIDKEKENLSEFGLDYFNKIQLSANRMQTLIQDLLAYSRTSNNQQNFEFKSINEVIIETTNDLFEEIEEMKGVIEVGITCHLHVIPFQIRQLFQNLISNSIKFAKPNVSPYITISCIIESGSKLKIQDLHKDEKYCHIRYTDNGIGFDQEYSQKIFELFQRLGSKEKYNGTGIGLAIVKKIVDNHNGVIKATSAIDHGATFDIYIPVQN